MILMTLTLHGFLLFSPKVKRELNLISYPQILERSHTSQRITFMKMGIASSKRISVFSNLIQENCQSSLFFYTNTGIYGFIHFLVYCSRVVYLLHAYRDK